MATLPAAVLTAPVNATPTLLYLAELLVALVEGIVYRLLCHLGWIEALGLGLALNAFSTAVGILLWQVWLMDLSFATMLLPIASV